MVKEVFIEDRLEEFLNKMLLVSTFSLCTVPYKIITKVLVDILKPIMSKLIWPIQTIFLLGRSITDNIIIAQ